MLYYHQERNMEEKTMAVFKGILKLLCWIISIAAIVLALYYLFAAGGIDQIKASIEANGFWGSFKEFFVELWNGFKATVGIK